MSEVDCLSLSANHLLMKELLQYQRQSKARVKSLLADTNKVPRELIIIGAYVCMCVRERKRDCDLNSIAKTDMHCIIYT